jgi:hypothetical protein
MSFKVNMAKELDETYAATLLLELKEKQVLSRKNKKRKKDNSTGLEKIKANQYDDDDDYDEYMVFRCDRVQINKNWYNSLNKVKKYINNKKKRPSIYNKDKKLAFWIRAQLTNYKNQEYNMKDKKIYCEWTKFMKKYQKYFLNTSDKWNNSLNKVKEYIDKNKKKPSGSDKDKKIQKLRKWINTQQANYKKKEHNMKDTNICCKWTQFIKKYQKYM